MNTKPENIHVLPTIDDLDNACFDQTCVWIVDQRIPLNIQQKIKNRCHHQVLLIDSGEHLKNLSSIEDIANTVLTLRSSRPLTLFAVGGGACGDAIGFLASILWRGVDLVHIPSTLLAMIDSSIGGKSAVNLGSAKNQLGSFYRARDIYLIEELLETMPDNLKREGLGEMIKSAWLDSDRLIDQIGNLQITSPPPEWMKAIENIANFKLKIVEEDPFDNLDIRIQLNFGHTVAHGIERLLGIPHGEAVAWGLLSSIEIAQKYGFAQHHAELLFQQLKHIVRPHGGIPALSADAFVEVLKRDKKRKNGVLRSIILTTPGAFEIRSDVSEMEWLEALKKVYARINQPWTISFPNAVPVTINPPCSKSEYIRLLSCKTNTSTTLENDDTFFASQIFQDQGNIVHVGEGATGFRFAAIQAAFTGREVEFTLSKNLSHRTHVELWDLLLTQRVKHERTEHSLFIQGKKASKVTISLSNQSTSHIASGIALLAAHNVEVDLKWTKIASMPYFEMTLDFLEQAGAEILRKNQHVRITPIETFIPPTIDVDAGAYAYWKILNTLGAKAKILGNLTVLRQPDFAIDLILDTLQNSTELIKLNINETPDLGPVLGAYAAVAKKDIQFVGAEHLRNKESNRIEDFVNMLTTLGVKCETSDDGFTVYGASSTLISGQVRCCNDHRLVMAATILALAIPLTLTDPMSISKSYWNFWDDLKSAGFELN